MTQHAPQRKIECTDAQESGKIMEKGFRTMPLQLNHHTFEKIRRNGRLITQFSCCHSPITRDDKTCFLCQNAPFVTLRGIRKQASQRWQWDIFIGKADGEPIATLNCAYCQTEVKTKDRKCSKCDVYCVLRIERHNKQWGLYRDCAQEPEPDAEGIRIQTQTVETKRPATVLNLDFSAFDLKLGELYCPNRHGIAYLGRSEIDENGICNTHHWKHKAVMIFKEDGIFIERRAHHIHTGEPQQIQEDKRQIAQLCCPACDNTPITDKTLLCQTCKTHLIDVVVKKYPSDSYRDAKLIIEIQPRHAWDTTRPPNAIVQEGDNWTDTTEQTPAEDTEPVKKDHDTIYAEYLELQKEDKNIAIRPAAHKIGIPASTLQYILDKIKKKEAQEKQKPPLTKHEHAQIQMERQRQERNKRPKKPPKWFKP